MRKRRDRRAYHIFCKQKQTEMMKKHFPYRTSRLHGSCFLGFSPSFRRVPSCKSISVLSRLCVSYRWLRSLSTTIMSIQSMRANSWRMLSVACWSSWIPIPVTPMPRRRNRSTNHCKAISRVLVCSSISLTTHWWSCSPPREALLRKWASSLATVLLPSMTPQ